jgi:hypothetical protein
MRILVALKLMLVLVQGLIFKNTGYFPFLKIYLNFSIAVSIGEIVFIAKT